MSRITERLLSGRKESNQTNKNKTNENIFYIILFYNQFWVKLLINVTVLLKPIHAVRQCIDKGSFLKMTNFRKLVFTPVLLRISSHNPITGMSLSDDSIKCVQ